MDENNRKALESFANKVETTGRSSVVVMFIVSLISAGLLDQVFAIVNKF